MITNILRKCRNSVYKEKEGESMFMCKNKITVILFFVILLFLIIQGFRHVFMYKDEMFLCIEPIDVVYTWVNGSDPRFIRSLQHFLQKSSTSQKDTTIQRFDDKYELKFSLRSLEKYAPWIRHVYIVTNGQIPYWLNLDYDKVTLVSHDEIFIDKVDLPTFSSPAIESHLHRIPGLSNRFIYFNDDIFLGSPIHLEDFSSASKGFLIYLAWPLPLCSDECPWSYVADGQCDTSCFNSNCQWDGGDCDYNNESDGNSIQSKNFKDEGDYEDESVDLTNVSLMNKINLSTLNKSNFLRTQNLYSVPVNNSNSKKVNTSNYTNKNVQQNKKFQLKANDVNITNIVNAHNKHIMLTDKIKRKKNLLKMNLKNIYAKSAYKKRNKLSLKNVDTYGLSLQHTHRVYNLKYGFSRRHVPAHLPVLIDISIMKSMQKTFWKEFRKTSRNKFRSGDDMQFSFSYYYYIIHERIVRNVGQIFDEFDTDGSGTWSDREIRTVLTKLLNLPISYDMVEHFENMLINCSKRIKYIDVPTPEFERYIDSKLHAISKQLVANCQEVSKILHDRFAYVPKYKKEIIKNARSKYVTFTMLTSNISEVVGHLDEIRRDPKKFICLNDNLDETKARENEPVKAVLYDFYMSLFPNPSKFELPPDYRNRFLYIDELNNWKAYHLKLKICIYFCVLVLLYMTFCHILKRRIFYRFVNKLFC